MFRNPFYTILLVIVLLSSLASASTISGTAYNLGLEVLDGTIFELKQIDGSTQRYVSTDGTYDFDVSSGNYQLIAQHGDLVAVDPITIGEDENLIHDVILIDDIRDLERLIQESEEDLVGTPKSNSLPSSILGIIAIAILALVMAAFAYRRRVRKIDPKTDPKTDPQTYLKTSTANEQTTASTTSRTNPADPADPTDLDESPENTLKNDVLTFILQESGRTTQKEIRKHFPYSEAKISLVISELEHEGKVKKIKKGRSNIIIKNG